MNARIDAPPAPGEFEQRPRATVHRLDEAGEAARAARHAYQADSVAAQLGADARNLKALQGDMRLVRLCRAYFLGDEAQRQQLADVAEKVLAEVRGGAV